MREYGSIQTQFWSDLTLQPLSSPSKLLAVYLLTGPHTNMLGCFRLPMGYVAEDLRWNEDLVTKAFSELAQSGFLIRDQAFGWIYIPRFLAWNPIANPNQGKSLVKLFAHVPEETTVYQSLVKGLLTQTKYLPEAFINRLETFSKRFLNQEQDQNQDQNQDQKHDQKQEHFQEQDVVDGKPSCDDLPSSSHTKKFPLTKINKNLLLTQNTCIAIPLQDNETFWIDDAQRERWQKTYPDIDVLQELHQLTAWNEANPAERKTQTTIHRHINAWLAKEQREASQKQQGPPSFGYSNRLAEKGLSSTLEHNLIVGERWLKNSENN